MDIKFVGGTLKPICPFCENAEKCFDYGDNVISCEGFVSKQDTNKEKTNISLINKTFKEKMEEFNNKSIEEKLAMIYARLI